MPCLPGGSVEAVQFVAMPLHPTVADVLLRLVLTMAAGAVIGIDRGVHNHAAGLRTTMLVGLAAAVAMVLANVNIGEVGRAPDAFVTMDVMRLPLGILTGVGFIGGGAILKRGELVVGLTTAATLWTVTVIGLCFGADQIALGLFTTACSFGILWGLKRLEAIMIREHRAVLTITTAGSSDLSDLASRIERAGCSARLLRVALNEGEHRLTSSYDVGWHGPAHAPPPPELFRLEQRLPDLQTFELTIGRQE